MIKETIKEAETRMKGAIQSLEEDLTGIRTGRASPALVERLQVEYYGAPVPLVQLASISVPEPRALLIRPFDATSLKAIERGILASDLGLTPNNDGKVIRLNLPPLTEERRRDLVKVVHTRLEEARVAVRNIRRDLIKDLREFEKEKMISEDDLKKAEEELQKLTDRFIQQIESDRVSIKKGKSWRSRPCQLRKQNRSTQQNRLQTCLLMSQLLWMEMAGGRPSAACRAWPVTSAGTENLRRVIRACVEFGVKYMTIYAFSTENWGRPKEEVEGLLHILEDVIDRELNELNEEGVQLRHIGHLDALPPYAARKGAQGDRVNPRITTAWCSAWPSIMAGGMKSFARSAR